MPIDLALLFCIPIGLFSYFEARWLLRHLMGRYEREEHRAARYFGVLGALLIPLIYCFGWIQDVFPGSLGEILATAFFMAAAYGLIAPIFSTLMKWSKG